MNFEDGYQEGFKAGYAEGIEDERKKSAALIEALDKDLYLRFWSKVDVKKKRQCWDWLGCKDKRGYGKLSVKNKPIGAHRISYKFYYGSIPKGLVIDHMCMNKSCVNPNHLRAVDYKTSNTENTNGTAAKNAKKTHCPKGHPYKGRNLFYGNGGERRCRICENVHKKNYMTRKRQALAAYRGDDNA